MTKRKLLSVVFLMFGFISACQESTDSNITPSVYNVVIPTSLITEEVPSVTPSSEPAIVETVAVPTQTKTPSMPLLPLDFPAEQIAQSMILSTRESATCKLPCWYGLRVGEIVSHDQVEGVFADIFNVSNEVNYFSPPDVKDFMLTTVLDIEGANGVGYHWYLEEPSTGVAAAYFLYAMIDETTGTFIGIGEHMRSFNVYDVPSMTEIVSHLGYPSWVVLSPPTSTLSFGLYYESGIFVGLTIDSDSSNNDKSIFCLDKDPRTAIITLTDEYESVDRNTFSPIQLAWDKAESTNTIDEVLDISIEEFMQVLDSDQPCLTI